MRVDLTDDGQGPVYEVEVDAAYPSDDELARDFIEEHAKDLLYCALMGNWLLWNGHCWKPDEKLIVVSQVREFLTRKTDHCGKFSRSLRGKSRVMAVEWLARSDQRTAAVVGQFDTDPWKLNTPSGIVDLKTGRLGPSDPQAFCTKSTTSSPSETAHCPQWLKFLRTATEGDEDLVLYLQRMAGYGLTGLIDEHALFFGYGPGGNGKGVFANTLTGILGDYAAVAPMETFCESSADRHPTDLAMLRGARFVISQETERGRAWAESKIKAMTGGDPITARFMRQDFFTYKPQFKLLIIGNHKPTLRSVDESVTRRFNILPFLHVVSSSERDKRLSEKLKVEWPAILRWAIEGCLLWRREGLNPPASVVSATAEYLESQDLFGEWLASRCDLEPDRYEKFDCIMRSWKQYAAEYNEMPGKKQDVADMLHNRGFRKGYWVGRAAGLLYKGLRVKPGDNGASGGSWHD